MADLEAALERVNHKSALSQQELLEELVADGIKSSFQVPLPINTVRKIKNAVVAPYGIVSQFFLSTNWGRELIRTD